MTAAGVPRVVVLDYGSGNLRSAARALTRAGADVSVTADPVAAASADGLVVPGVGAFAACIAGIEAVGGRAVVAGRVAEGRPVLGICVGMQVLFEVGREHGVVTKGLGVLPGEVTRLRAPRVPHMGWNTAVWPDDPLFAGLSGDSRCYFVHSYAARPTPLRDAGIEVATTTYGEEFAAAVVRDGVAATQFHPEKSGDVGATLLANWVGGLR